MPYTGYPVSWPSPSFVDCRRSAVTAPTEGETADGDLLQQVLALFSAELRSPMDKEVVARIEEEAPEVLAEYDDW